MILGCCVSGNTTAVHTEDVGSSQQVRVPLEANFFCSIVFNVHYIVKVTNTELRDINRLMGHGMAIYV